MEEKPQKKPLFQLLDNHAFDKLSTEEKAKYIEQAAQAMKNGALVVTPNTPHYLRKPESDSS